MSEYRTKTKGQTMTRFVDGPAKGKVLMLRRAPRFLRVTEEAGQFDALDQLDDQPKPTEKLYAYEITGTAGYAFVDGPKCRGRYAIASYHLVPQQPADEDMRTIARWHDWCVNAAKQQPKDT